MPYDRKDFRLHQDIPWAPTDVSVVHLTAQCVSAKVPPSPMQQTAMWLLKDCHIIHSQAIIT